MTKNPNRGGLREPKGGRPPKSDKYQAISLKLPPDLLQWLNTHTDNRNKFIIEAIKEKIEKAPN